MQKLVLVRHGESTWNKEDRFTGWTDVDLTSMGVEQAKEAGKCLRKHGYEFEIAFTSVLKRAIKTLQIILEEVDQLWIPVEKSWRMNERFYGDLQGLNKGETIRKFGEEQVHKWRRDPYEHPPALTKNDERYPGKDLKYKSLKENEIPLTENLSETMARVLPFWLEKVVPALKFDQKVIIVGHNNSLRALIKHIDQLTDEDVINLSIPTGMPLVYEFDQNLNSIKHYYLNK